jgi:hypothetical protein
VNTFFAIPSPGRVSNGLTLKLRNVVLRVALASLPPDEATARSLERGNGQHPMGPPLNRPWSQERLLGAGDVIRESKVAGDPDPLPDFLKRAA